MAVKHGKSLVASVASEKGIVSKDLVFPSNARIMCHSTKPAGALSHLFKVLSDSNSTESRVLSLHSL